MAQFFIQEPAPSTAQTRVSAEPVLNILNSMALLHNTAVLPALSPWAIQAAAALSDAELHTNQLLFSCLAGALVARASAPDFEAYLDALTTEHPEALRNHALASLIGPDATAKQLLADRESYLEQARKQTAERIDEQLYSEAYALLSDPFRMHDVIISHVRSIWEKTLLEEWSRVQRSLENQARLLQSSPGSGVAPERILERLQNLVAPTAVRGAQELIFVPSAHTGRYTTVLQSGGTSWVFFDAQINYPALLRESPVGQTELLTRLNALTEPIRLRVLELLAQQGELTMQEIMEQLDVSQPNASRYLKSLGIFVAERRGKDGKKHYRLIPTQLDLTFQALKQSILSNPPPAAKDQKRDPQAEPITRWLDPRNLVNSWPARERDRLVVLEYIASFFKPGTYYSEQEVNALLLEHVLPYARDHVTVRRDLVDFQYLRRASDGSRYWRNTENPGQPPEYGQGLDPQP